MDEDNQGSVYEQCRALLFLKFDELLWNELIDGLNQLDKISIEQAGTQLH
jgi:hypothetical protein